MRTSHLFLLFLFLNYSLTMAQKPKLKEDDKKSIDSLTKGLKKQVGLLISYHKEGEIYFEIGNDLYPEFNPMISKLSNLEISIKEATEELLTEIEIFKSRFSGKENEREMHPIFGELNYKEWLIYHNKHFQHHFQQFNLMKEEK